VSSQFHVRSQDLPVDLNRPNSYGLDQAANGSEGKGTAAAAIMAGEFTVCFCCFEEIMRPEAVPHNNTVSATPTDLTDALGV
jgi:hypothetical protein